MKIEKEEVTNNKAWQKLVKRSFNTLLTYVCDKTIRKYFDRNMSNALVVNDAKNIDAVLTDVEKYLKHGKAYLVGKKYTIVPTFDQAVMDCLLTMCKDLENIPDLDEYFTKVEIEGVREDIYGYNECAGRGGKSTDKSNLRRNGGVETFVRKNMILTSAPTQSGKSGFISCTAIRSMLTGFTPIIVLRNISDDAEQLQRNIQNKIDSVLEYLDEHGVQKRRINFDGKILLGSKLTSSRTLNKFLSSMDGKEPHFLLCLANETQLERVNELVDTYPYCYDLFIDEMDNIDYGTKRNGELCGTAAMLKVLKDKAHQVFGITATPFDIIFSEKELKSVNQLRLMPPSDYRGFCDIQVKLLDCEVHAMNKLASYREQLLHDPNLKGFLDYFSKTTPACAYRFNMQRIPNICLIKNTRFIENQVNLARGINKEYPRIATMVYNGSGVLLYYRKMDIVTIAGKQVVPNQFCNITIADALQHLFDNGGVKKFPHIIIVAGDLAGRGISYVTRNYRWHTTDMYYVPAKNTPIHEIIQSAGRLCGRNRGMSHLHLHTPEKVARALYDGFNFMDETITRAIAQPLMDLDDEKSFADSLMSVPMNKRKMPTGRNLTGKVKIRKSGFNLVKDTDGGRDLKTYKYETVEEREAEILRMCRESYEIMSEDEKAEFTVEDLKELGIGVDEDEKEVVYELPDEEFRRLTDILFPKWSKQATKIARFMQNLDPRRVYTKVEIEEYGVRVRNVMTRRDPTNNNGYGMIMKKIREDRYQLYPELLSHFQKYF